MFLVIKSIKKHVIVSVCYSSCNHNDWVFILIIIIIIITVNVQVLILNDKKILYLLVY